MTTRSVRVFLTVASWNETSVKERELELNWYEAQPEEGDWIGLFNQDPKAFSRNNFNHSTNLLYRDNIDKRSKGSSKTSVYFPRLTFEASTLKSECLGFWVAYIRNNQILATNCLQSRPDWMWENRQSLGNFRLREIFIPGTHNSGSYSETMKEDIVSSLTNCQDESIWNQLVYGNRYLDFRIGYYENDPEKYWLNHDIYQINPLKEAFADIVRFMNKGREIVLLDFHRFPVGMDTPDRHKDLIRFIEKELGHIMLPRLFEHDVTLNAIWDSGKRLLVFYNDDAYLNSNLLWPGIWQQWGNTNTVNGLKNYFDSVMVNQYHTFWAAMAELTPSWVDSLSHPFDCLRYFADLVNLSITEWFREIWWNKVNIVATDFFHGNNITEVAIEANLKRRSITSQSENHSLALKAREVNFQAKTVSLGKPRM